MTQITQDTRSVEETEQKLWADYLVLLARRDECWRLYREAWRNYVLTGLQDAVKGRVWDRCIALHDMWRDRERAAYREWQKVAYRLHNIPLRDEDNKSE